MPQLWGYFHQLPQYQDSVKISRGSASGLKVLYCNILLQYIQATAEYLQTSGKCKLSEKETLHNIRTQLLYTQASQAP